MMTRPFIILLAGTLLSSAVANADRRRRDRDRAAREDDEEEKSEDKAPTRTAKRSIGGEDRRRAARAVEEDDDDRDDDRPKKQAKREKAERVADIDSDVETDGAEAKGIVAISLDELIEVTVRHSPNLARAKLERTAARGDAGASRIDQAWRFNADAKYTVQGIGGDVEVDLATVVQEEKIDGSIALSRKTPVGGSIEAKLAFNRTWKEFAVSKEALNAINGLDPSKGDKGFDVDLSETSTSHQAVASLTLTQSLLRGFGSDIALAKEHKADLAASEATLNAQFEAEKTILDVIKDYWETSVAADELEIRNQALDMAQRHEKLTRDEIRAGAAANNALSPVLYEIASRNGAKLRAEIELDRKSLELRRKAGLNLADRTLVVRPNQALVIGDEDFDISDMLSRSRKANRRLVMLALRRRQADVDVKVASNAMLPQADVSLSAGLMGTGASSGEAFSRGAAADGYQVMASLTFQWEISGAAKDAHKAALARRTIVEVDRIEIEREIETDVAAAVARVKAARKRVVLADEAIRLAEENVKNERGNFENQKSNNFEVMKRQSELVESMLSRTRAVADYHIAVAQLQFSTGTLLENYRVNVRPVAEK